MECKELGNERVQEIIGMRGVQRVKGDMCAFGMKQKDEWGEGLVKKRTGFMTNSGEIAKRLAR